MKKIKINDVAVYVATILISILISYFGSSYFMSLVPTIPSEGYKNDEFHQAKISQIVSERVISDSFEGDLEVVFKAVISSGPFQHREITVNQIYDDAMVAQLYPLSMGDSIVLYRSVFDQRVEWRLVSFARSNLIGILVALFLILIILFGRWQGFNAIVSLGFTVFAVFFILIPAILANLNLYVITLGVALYIIIMSFILIGGITKKTIAASLGCMGGILVATLLAIIFTTLMRMSGILSEDYVHLVFIENDLPLNLTGILFVSIVVGSLGAVMDVAMSIASSLQELIDTAPSISVRQIIFSGMSIGKDIMGTMANTLILAYIGSSLPTILLMIIYAKPINLLIHSEYMAAEVLQAVAGSLGILFAIPVTSILSAMLYRNRVKQKKLTAKM